MALALNEQKVYQLNGGINTSIANEVLKPNVAPFLRNSRYKSLETQGTRTGNAFYSVPVGMSQDASNTLTVTADNAINTNRQLAVAFIPNLNQPIVGVDLRLKTGTDNPTGYIVVEIWSDIGNKPGVKLSSSSINPGNLSSSYSYQRAWFNMPPIAIIGTQYWIVSYIQEGGSGTYYWGSSAGTGTAVNIGGGFTALATDLVFKTYYAPNQPVIGGIRFSFSNGVKASIFATKTGVYQVNETTGVPTSIFAGNPLAERYQFEFYNDVLYWVNSYDVPQQWNGTSQIAVPGSPPVSMDLKQHKNMLFLQDASDPARYQYSAIGNPSSWPAVNFFYVPAPKSNDFGKKMQVFQDQLLIHKRSSRYELSGYSIDTFALRKSNGLQGVLNGFCSALYRNYEYFVSDEGIGVYNGSTDEIISQAVQPDFEAIAAKDKMTIDIQGNYLRVYYPGQGSLTNSMCFVVDLLHNNQFYIDNAKYVSYSFASAIPGEQDTLYQGSAIVGALYYGEQDGNYTDLGDAIHFQYWTKYDSFGAPNDQHRIKRFYPEFTGQTGKYNCNVYADLDYAGSPQLVVAQPMQRSGARLGIDFRLGISRLGSFGNIKPRLQVSGYGSRVQYRFDNYGINQPVEIIGYTSYYQSKRPK